MSLLWIMISWYEARTSILKEAEDYKKQVFRIGINKCIGFILAENIKARHNSPPFNQSAMDGYALRHEDLKSGKEIQLNSQSESSAGKSGALRLEPLSAIRIFTGAKVPSNATLVVAQENVEIENDHLVFSEKNFPVNHNIRSIGSQFRKGEIILRKGEMLSAARIAIAAAAGYASLKVNGSPKVAIIITGNELARPGSTLTGSMVYESNSVMLEAVLNEHKVAVTKTFYAKDDSKHITQAFKKSIKDADIVLLSGGISVGKYDLVKDVLVKNGVKTIFHKVRQKPGKPLYFGRKGKKYIFGLPGNPAASLTCFYEYVLPFLKVIRGFQNPFGTVNKATLLNDYTKKKGLTYFLKGKVSAEGLCILPDQESYKLTSFADANCLIVLPEDAEILRAGEAVEYHLI